MSYAFNNQKVGKTIIISYTYWEKHIGKHEQLIIRLWILKKKK